MEILEEQIKEYNQNRVLPKSKTTYTHLIIAGIVFFLLIGVFVLTAVLLPMKICCCLLFWGGFVLFLDLYCRYLMYLAICCYRHYAKEDVRRRCLCYPSCSEFAIIILKRNFLLPAVFKIYKRLFKTCKGAYKIDLPYRKYNIPFK